DQRHAQHALLRPLDPLADRLRHLVGLPETEAHPSCAVADHDQGAEAEAAAALDDLRHAIDVDDLLLELASLRIEDLSPRGSAAELRHLSVSLELEPALAGPVSDRANAAMVEEAVAVEDHPGDALLLASARDQQADLLGRTHVARLLDAPAQVRRHGRHGEERALRLVGDDLHVDVLVAAEDRQPRPGIRSPDALADAVPP